MTKRKTRKRNSEVSKETITLSALKAFCEKGYESCTIDDIMEKANASHGLFYHYFKNKKEIFDIIIKERKDFIDKETVEKLYLIPDYKEKLSCLTKKLFDNIREDETYSYYFYFFVSQAFNKRDKKAVFKKETDKVPPHIILENMFSSGQEKGFYRTDFSPKDLVKLYMSIIKGATIHYVIAPKEIQKEISFPNENLIVSCFCKGE